MKSDRHGDQTFIDSQREEYYRRASQNHNSYPPRRADDRYEITEAGRQYIRLMGHGMSIKAAAEGVLIAGRLFAYVAGKVTLGAIKFVWRNMGVRRDG